MEEPTALRSGIEAGRDDRLVGLEPRGDGRRRVAARLKFSPARFPAWPVDLATRLLAPSLRAIGYEPGWLSRVGFFTDSRAHDITRARTTLGNAPVLSLREGICRTVAWYRGSGPIAIVG